MSETAAAAELGHLQSTLADTGEIARRKAVIEKQKRELGDWELSRNINNRKADSVNISF